MGFLQLSADRTELFPPCRDAKDRQLNCTWPSHGEWVGDVWLVGVGREGDGNGSELHFGSSKLKTLWLCVPPTAPSFQSSRLKRDQRKKERSPWAIDVASVVVSFASNLECHCWEPRYSPSS